MKKLKRLISLLFVGISGGLLGAMGGTSGISKGVRRFGIPTILTIFAIYTLHNFWCISIMFMSFALSVGYGIPDPPNYINGDKGSTLGRFWFSFWSKIIK